MSFIIYYLLPFVVVLGVLIFFHELGHFLAAKYFGVGVEKFSLGFGPKIVGKKIGETEYMVSAVPLGGYVKLLGEDEEEGRVLTPEEEAKSFNHQHALKRMVIVLAGPVFNIILALFIFIFFYMFAGAEIMVPEVGQVTPGSPAEHAGLKKGDLIIAIDGIPIKSWDDLKEAVAGSNGKPLKFTVKRKDETIVLSVRPRQSEVKNIFGEKVKTMLVGIVQSGRMEIVSVGFIRAIALGFERTWDLTRLTVLTVVKLLQRVIPLNTLGGPILIGQMTGHLAKESFIYLIPFTGMISINLGVLNLLPIPVLDGGLILFLLIELVTGKPLTLKLRERVQQVGIALLAVLMAVVLYNDIVRLLK